MVHVLYFFNSDCQIIKELALREQKKRDPLNAINMQKKVTAKNIQESFIVSHHISVYVML